MKKILLNIINISLLAILSSCTSQQRFDSKLSVPGELIKNDNTSSVGAKSVSQVVEIANSSKNYSTELELTDIELAEISKWKHKAFEEMFEDAFEGDAAALFNIGACFLTGRLVGAINVQAADLYFGMSAYLGFGPALDQIMRMYLTDKHNSILALVYLNLTVASGHSELFQYYHEFRSSMIQSFGESLVAEIERIASIKFDEIEKNKTQLAKAGNKNSFLFRMGSIADLDEIIFDANYWLKFVDHNRLKESSLKNSF